MDEDLFARLLHQQSLGAFECRSTGEQELTDRYLDTAARDILRGGYTCRLREFAGRDSVCVTLDGLGVGDGALHRPEVHEVEVPRASDPRDWPEGEARDLLLRLRRGAALQQLVAIRQRRSLRSLLQNGTQIATLSLDVLEIEGSPHPPLCEIEIELAPAGGPSELQVLGEILESQGARPQTLSERERALALLEDHTGDKHAPSLAPPSVPQSSLSFVGHGQDSEPLRAAPPSEQRSASVALLDRVGPDAETSPVPADSSLGAPIAASEAKRGKQAAPGVRADEPMAEAGRKILGIHFERMLANEADVRAGSDIEALHDMRVAIRRQRAALRIVAPEFQRKVMRPFRKELRVAARCLGAVRDLDVQIEAATRYQSSLSTESARAFQPVIEVWQRRQESARVELLSYLDSSGYRNLTETHSRFLHSPGKGALRSTADSGIPVPHLVRDVLPGRIWQQYGAVHAYAMALPCASVQTLHALRIETKRLRYILEFFRGLLDPRVDKGIEALVALQDRLGELHDADVSMEMLSDLVANRTEAQPEAAELVSAISGYFDAQSVRLQRLRSTLPQRWQRVISKRFKQFLARSTLAV